MYILWNLLLNALLLFRQHLLDLKSGHTTTPSTRNRLPVPLILHITGSKHPLNARLCRSGDGQNVPIGIDLKLVAHDGGGGFVTDSVEEAGDREIFLFVVQHVLDAEVVKEVPVALAFNRDCVPKDGLRLNKIV